MTLLDMPLRDTPFLAELPRGPAPTQTPALLAVSHGTSSPSGQRAVSALVDAVAVSNPGVAVSGGFVDVQQPDVADSLARLVGLQRAVVVPLLLSAGYHVHVDLSREIAVARRAMGSTSIATSLARALGPDDRLVAILAGRLHEAGLRSTDSVVMAAAGSSDPRAVADCAEMARRLAVCLGREVRLGFISAATPRLGDAVEDARAAASGGRVVISSYLLAPGYFAELAGRAGADVVTSPLLAEGHEPPHELVALVGERYSAEAAALASTEGSGDLF